MYVLGEPAFQLANVLNRRTRRPMKDGLISPKEQDALPVMKMLISSILGEPRAPQEVCFYSVPGDPVDSDLSVAYHRDLFDAVLKSLGYKPSHILEGHAVTFAELAEEDFTGIGISCGGGMFNVCVAYKSVPALTFATSRGGDWIDNNVSAAIGLGSSQVCALKESGVDLNNPKDRVQDAIVIYYRNLIQYTLETIRTKLDSAQNMPSFTRPIEVVCGGGTSMIGGFIDVFREEFEKVNFPIEVSNIRMANDPLKAVARGCMTAAMEETRSLLEEQITIAPAALARSENMTTTKAEPITKRRFAPQRVVPQVVERSAPVRVEAAKPIQNARRSDPVVVRTEPSKFVPKPPSQTRPQPSKPVPPPAPLEEISELEEVTDLEELKPEGGNGGGSDLPLIS